MEFPWYSFLFPLLVIIFFLHKWFFTTSNTQRKLLPPSPRKLPIIGDLHQLGLHPHRSLQKLSKKHGPIMLLHLGCKPVLIASSAEVARYIMKTQILSGQIDLNLALLMESIVDPKMWPLLLKVNTGDKLEASPCFTFLATKRVQSFRGDKLEASPCFTFLATKRVQSFRDVREDETSNMIDKIRQECDSSDNSVIDLRDVLCSLTHNIINRVTLGRTYEERESGIDVKALIEEQLELVGVFNIGDYIPWLKWLNKINGLDMRVKKVAKNLDAFLENVIEEHIIRTKKETVVRRR